jgi:hypothetical protein
MPQGRGTARRRHDPTPSQADIQMTKETVAVARPLGIAMHPGQLLPTSHRTVELTLQGGGNLVTKKISRNEFFGR